MNQIVVYLSMEYVGSRRAGGIATYVQNVAENLISVGYQVFVISANDNVFESKNIQHNQVNYILLPGGDFFVNDSLGALGLIISSIFNIFNYKRIRRRIRNAFIDLNENYNVVYVESTEVGMEALYLSTYLNSREISSAIKFHGLRFFSGNQNLLFRDRKSALFLIEHCMVFSILVFPSNSYAREFVSSLKHFDIPLSTLPKMVILPNFIKEIDKSALVGQNRSCDLVYCGSITETKGSSVLLRSLDELLKSKNFSNITINLAGKKSRNIIFPHSVRNFYLGLLNNNEVNELYAKTKYAIFPSFWENQSMSLIEGISNGCVIIASDIPSHVELLEGIKGVFFYDSRSVRSLVEILRFVLMNNIYVSERDFFENVSIINARVGFKVGSSKLIQYFNLNKNASE